MEVEIKVDGLPITVDVKLEGPDREVGIMSSYVDDYTITQIGSRMVRKGEKLGWIERKITDKHLWEMAEKAEEAYRESADDYRIEDYRDRYGL